MITHRGKTQSIVAWSRECGVSANVIRSRMHRGWSIEAALSRPAKEKKARRLTHGGKTLTVNRWAGELGISQFAMRWRMRHWRRKAWFTEKGNNR
jgi:hypothetical protein